MPKLHPDKCIKYCRFGFDQSKGGCSGNCSLLHPTLCRNSLEYKQCYCENCTFAHLSGTERSQKDILPQQFQPSSNLYQNHSSHNGHGQWYRHSQNAQYSVPANNGLANNVQRNHVQRSHFQRNNVTKPRESFVYQQKHFPPLPSINEDRTTELTLYIQQMQKSIEFMMQSVQFKDGTNQTRVNPNIHQTTLQDMPNNFSYGEVTQALPQAIPNQFYSEASQIPSQAMPNQSYNQAKNY